jgi:multidrug efflux pump subunit AcrA (membrane-fusion protein)
LRRRTWAPAIAAVLVALAATGGVVAVSDGTKAAPAAQGPPVSTATVEQGPLAAVVSLNGTLSYRARADGSPYPVINQARGTYTKLPEVGAKVGCGDVLYRVDDRPVLLLCGTVPAYRDLHRGDAGRDVRQLNRNLRLPAGTAFTGRTKAALERLQRRRGLPATGRLALDEAVFLPRPVRIGTVACELGASARPGVRIAQATADALHVQVDLDASQQGEVKKGDLAEVTLQGNTRAKGAVARLGRVAQAPEGKDGDPEAATVPAFISLDDPGAARGLESAPVQVDVMTKGVERALSVPVTALVGKSGGGLAVDVVRAGGRRELVAVRVGLFDDAHGRVEVEGDLRPGEHVVVPSS